VVWLIGVFEVVWSCPGSLHRFDEIAMILTARRILSQFLAIRVNTDRNFRGSMC
jgi:hypothetical protein